MIPHEQFGKLRLAHFLARQDIAELSGWEFMDDVWLGEAFGFSEWLRLESDPDTLRSLAIAFGEFPLQDAQAVLRAIQLPVRPGMRIDELKAVLGEPAESYRFANDRATHEFVVEPPEYRVSCTVTHRDGLVYLVVTVPGSLNT
jgi:hypothetical protein